MAASVKASGRRAQTRGISMQPEEVEDLQAVQDLSGMGPSQLYHQHVGPRVKAAAELLRALHADGVEINRYEFSTIWNTAETPEQIAAAYTAVSTYQPS